METAVTFPESDEADLEKTNILIVDDRADKLLALESVLVELNQNLVLARSGKEALRCLLRQDFAVILLDVNMPGIDGFETAALIRQRARSEFTPIILVSAVNDSENHVSRGYSLGAVDYILTPIVPEILRAKVSVFVDLFRKTAQVKRQGEERAQLIRTEAARADAEAARERSAFLAQASSILAGSLNLDQTFSALAEVAVPRLADGCLVSKLENTSRLRVMASAHINPGQANVLAQYREAFPMVEVSAQLLDNLSSGENPPFASTSGEMDSFHMWSSHEEVLLNQLETPYRIIVALRARGRLLGTLCLFSKGERFTATADASLIQEVAHHAAVALDNGLLYEDAQRAQHDAEHANRSKDQFLAMLSHELRTPLTPVLTAVALLDEDEDFPPALRGSLEVIRRNIQLEARLIDDLLDLTRVSKGKVHLNLETLDVHELIRRSLEICQSEIHGKRLRVKVEAAAQESWVEADAARLQQIFWNLIKNAVKFTPEGGWLSIATSSNDKDLTVTVSDSGIGIEGETLPKIFDAFEQGALGRDGGLGLGLAITRSLVTLHGGTISAASHGRDQGSAFTVSLPLIEAPEKTSFGDGVPAPADPKQRRALHLLLVEDHADSNVTLTRLLTKRGYTVESALSVAEGLRLATEGDFDLLVSDLGLPDGTGLELVEKVHAIKPMRAIALSGFGMEEDVRRAKTAGFSAHLTKPVDLAELDRVIQRIAE